MGKERFDGLLKWRNVGPFRGGRVVTVAGDPRDRNVFYFGACAGGVWKTDDGGHFWRNISDGFFNTAAVGALAVSESDPNVIYAGTGESTIRIDVSHGDGVYKSVDGGESWTHVGLRETRFISKIRVHPTNPDIVYVAALGHAYGPNEERGVYKSTDGGATWRKVLYKSDKAGAADLSIDPNNPRIMYASIWETYRKFWIMSSGGPDSGLYKSVDGGESWTDITKNPGLPGNIWGKVGVAVSPAKPGRVWALIENKDEGMYRSDDGGATWMLTSNKTDLLSRAWYYTHVTADPQDADTVYVNCLRFWKSSDGGRSWDMIGTPHGDNHDLWIDPQDNTRMVQGNDGGANVSYNSGVTWSSIYNQPTGQIYRLALDNQKPYRIYGTQQDNSSISVPSRTHHSSITWTDCYLAGSGESGWVAPDPRDPNVLFVGAIGSSPGGGNALQRYDHKNGEVRLVTTWPESMRARPGKDSRYRFSWTYPILFSIHDPNKLWAGGNHLFQTTNDGQSWDVISPDLSRQEAEKQEMSGGPINREIGSAEMYATIFALAESHFTEGVIWAGTDDGLLHITHDGGGSWEDVTPAGMPTHAMVHTIETSTHSEGTAYIAATCFKLDDFAPYLYKTTDHGKSWTRINDGIPDDDYTRVIRSDPAREGLLYAGTETGLYISFDDGSSWERFQLNLPVCPIYDMKIKDNDLVVATHGRAFWILDDLTPLHQYGKEVRDKDIHLFKPRETLRVMPFVMEGRPSMPGKNYMSTLGLKTVFESTVDDDGIQEINYLDSGSNPPKGGIITYHLHMTPAEPIELSIADSDGNVIRSYRSRKDGESKKDGPFVPANAGWNRFVWDLRHEPPTKINGTDAAAELAVAGAHAAPGSYVVSLRQGDQVESQSFELVKEPGATGSQADLEAQTELLIKINAKISEIAKAINKTRALRGQLDYWKSNEAIGAELAAAAGHLSQAILDIEEVFAVPGLQSGWTEPNNQGARLYDQLASLPPVVHLGNHRPTDQAVEAYEYMAAKVDEQLDNLEELLSSNVAAFNAKMAAASISAVTL